MREEIMTLSNQTIIDCWLTDQKAANVNISTDGNILRSYNDLIGKTLRNGAKIVLDKTAPAGAFKSVTTSRHVNMCKDGADGVEHPTTGDVEVYPLT